MDLRGVSLAQWFDEVEKHKCGYCKNPNGSISIGMMFESVTVEEYQDLIDRGWRRSGKYCYKPTMDKTCCPQYTIRCDSSRFSLNKSHKKTIKKFNKFLSDGVLHKNFSERDNDQEDNIPACHEQHKNSQNSKLDLDRVALNHVKTSELLDEDTNSSTDKIKNKNCSENIETKLRKSESQKSAEAMVVGSPDSQADSLDTRNSKSFKPGSGANPSKPPCKKAKLLRLERKKQKLQKLPESNSQDLQANSDKSKLNVQKSLGQFLEETPSSGKHKIKLHLVPCQSDEWQRTKDAEFELYKKYQMLVHNDPEDKLSMNSFCRFLVSSPLKPEKFPDGLKGVCSGYGSFHQLYWLDDKLIAVGVIDILPKCVSSVYFFYDPDYRDLTLGTYGSLREIQLTKTLSTMLPDLRYYYMGFYIHSCPKMRYKGKLVPSDLLCPETYVWVPIEKCLPKLDQNKYSRLNEDVTARDANLCSTGDLYKIKIIHNYTLMTVKEFVRHFDGDLDVFKNLGKLVGKKSSSTINFWIL